MHGACPSFSPCAWLRKSFSGSLCTSPTLRLATRRTLSAASGYTPSSGAGRAGERESAQETDVLAHAPQMSSAHFWGAGSVNAVVKERMAPPQTRSAACGAASRLATQNALLARQGPGGAITSGLTRCPSEHAHARAARGVCRARQEHASVWSALAGLISVSLPR